MAPDRPPPPSEPRGRVLVVDDSEPNITALAALVRGAGFTADEAASGEAALALAAARPPDLVLLDVVMTGIDGFETCRRLKALPGCADVPVLFVTALSDVEAKVRAFDAGGVDHLTKPFDPREVIARVHAHVSLRQLRRDLMAERAALAVRNVELQRVVGDLTAALAQVQALRGLLPICAHCKGIRDDQGYWHQVEAYISAHSPAQFTHGICPRCLELHHPERPDAETPAPPRARR